VELKKEGRVFSKTVDLPLSDKNIHYTFVVDGSWVNDDTAPTEKDEDGYTNNVLKPADIAAKAQSDQGPRSMLGAAGAMISGIGPSSSTAHMAGRTPLEKSRTVDQKAGETPSEDMPGAFPDEIPFHEAQEYRREPGPVSSGLGHPSQLARGEAGPGTDNYHSNDISQNVRDDYSLAQDPKDYEKALGVAPLPATAGIGNPVKLQPGEKVPSSDTFTSNTIQNNVKTDRASYERSDAYPGDAAQDEHDSAPDTRRPAFGVPPAMSGMIPESSLPMGSHTRAGEKGQGPFVRSAGPGTSAAALAGQVPLEPRGVPRIVRESQRAAHFPPEASASSDAVVEKREIEQELKSKVPVEQPITGGSRGLASDDSPVPEVVRKSQWAANFPPEASASSDAVYEKREIEQELKSKVPVEQPITTNSSRLASDEPPVPEVVIESQHKAHASPEASASPMAVQEKSAVEQELLSKMPVRQPMTESSRFANNSPLIPEVVSKSQHNAHAPPEASASPVAVQEKSAVEQELLSKMPVRQPVAESSRFASESLPIPEVVSQSQHNAHAPPEASASPLAVQEKSAVEQELLSKVRTEQPRSYTSAAPGDTAPGVPAVVGESQQAAQAPPEASASEDAVKEKSAFEQELKSKVPEESVTSESSTHHTGILAAVVAGGAAVIGGAAAVVTEVPAAITKAITDINAGMHHHSASNSAVPERVPESQEPAHQMPGALPESEDVSGETAMEEESISKVAPAHATDANMSRNTFATTGNVPRLDSSATANTVPERVRESLQAAHRSPEAAANPEAVMEKKDVERELLREIKPAPATGARFLENPSSSTGRDSMPDYSTTANTVPERVRESLQAAHQSPEAAANPEAVSEKRDVEKELMREIPPAQSSAEPARTTNTNFRSNVHVAPTSRSSAMLSSGAPSGTKSAAPTSTMTGSLPSGDMIHSEPVLATMSTSTWAGNINPTRSGPEASTGPSPIREEMEYQRTTGALPSTMAGSEGSGLHNFNDDDTAPAMTYANRNVEPEREDDMRSDHTSTSEGMPSTFGGMLSNFGGTSPRSGGWTDAMGPMSSTSGGSSPTPGGVSKATLALAAGMTGVSAVGAGVLGEHFSQKSSFQPTQPDSSASFADRSRDTPSSAGPPASYASAAVADRFRNVSSSEGQPASSTSAAVADRFRNTSSSDTQPVSSASTSIPDRFRNTSSSDGQPIPSTAAAVTDRFRDTSSSSGADRSHDFSYSVNQPASSAAQAPTTEASATNFLPMATGMTGVSAIGAGAVGEHFSHSSPSRMAQPATPAFESTSFADRSRDIPVSGGPSTLSAAKTPTIGAPATNALQMAGGMTGISAVGAGAVGEHFNQSSTSAMTVPSSSASTAVGDRSRDIPFSASQHASSAASQPLSSAARQPVLTAPSQPLSSARNQPLSSGASQPLSSTTKTPMTGASITDPFYNDPIPAPGYNPTTYPASKPAMASEAFRDEPLSVNPAKSSFTPKAAESLAAGGVGAGALAAATTAGKSSTPLSTLNSASKAATAADVQPGPGLYIPPSTATKPAATEPGSLRAPPTSADTKPGPGLNAPASTPAKSAATESSMLSALPTKPRTESRDISPFSKQPGASSSSGGPSAATGVGGGSSRIPEKSTPTKGGAAGTGAAGGAGVGSSSSAGGSPSSYRTGTGESSKDEKRRKRTSFFGKIKDKLHRDK